MKKILLAAVAALLTLSPAFAKGQTIEKKGFLVSLECLKQDRLTNCPLTEYNEDAKIVLYVHDDLKYYNLNLKAIPKAEIDEGFARNGVTIIGEYDRKKNLITAHEYKAPPPPAKSFFKGCL